MSRIMRESGDSETSDRCPQSSDGVEARAVEASNSDERQTVEGLQNSAPDSLTYSEAELDLSHVGWSYGFGASFGDGAIGVSDG